MHSDSEPLERQLRAQVRAALDAVGAEAPGDGAEELIAAADEATARAEEELLELAAAGGEEIAARYRALLELQDARVALLDDRLRRRVRLFARIFESLGRLRRVGTVDEMIARAPAEAAAACDFDRVVLYRVDGSELLAEAFFIRDDPEGAARLLAFSRRHPVRLREQIMEREMLRQRRPMVVHDALNHPHTFKPLVEPYGTHAYVAAPIMPEGRVIGFMHGDKGLRRPADPEAVDEFDRDALFAFAEGFGAAVERRRLLERLRTQGEDLRRLINQAERVLAEQLEVQIDLASEDDDESRAAAALFAVPAGPELETALSRREREVLALVAEGATNSEIGEALVITEATVKSHMKRVLRKLGVANRVEAAAAWVRAGGKEETAPPR